MSTIDTAVRFFTGMDERDARAATDGFADDATYFGIEYRDGRIHRKTYQGKQAIHDYIAAWVGAAGNLKYTLRGVVGDDRQVMIEWSDVARSRDGYEYENRGVLVFDFNADRKVQDVRAYYDFAPLQEFQFLDDKPAASPSGGG